MGGENINIGVLVDSKVEYTQKMIDVVSPFIYKDFYDMFQEGCEALNKLPGKAPKEIFTLILKNVSKWPDQQGVIATYTNRMLNECDWLMSLLKTIIAVNTMILAAIRDSSDSGRVNVELPEAEVFVYSLYKKVASKLSPNVFLHFYSGDDEKIEKAEEKMAAVIEKCIRNVIAELLPMKHLISQYMTKWESNHFTCDDSVLPLPVVKNEEDQQKPQGGSKGGQAEEVEEKEE